ncbi:tripartite ATP-independent transporter DctM subunit [Rhodobium orientis]|uniref:TRAP transporter large permease protein n=1 Tax=Rhodobium orientis TaxID=34017 RepID=A0A327JLF1_9HYPH|nr:TRAP transporter large permease [Rhodobium orientis]MBB4304952.1 tripartite ATP-independent transporter DctM subunit [Rhodobium orientis]MBK5951271.1 C4-dicarboxylate ABC transporter permease [Rhodobium orientis]RAI27107.1 C4-dicarboxylate ABC transporter permease [Rhodobium orientis]
MDMQTTGILSILALFVVVLLGCPVGLAMIVVGFGGFAAMIGVDPALSVLKTAAFETASSYSFTLVPLFILMGNLVSQSGMAGDLFRASERLTRGWSGGLGAAGITASAVFSTVSGSSLATASTMTRVAYPEMVKRGYDARLAAGSLAAGGTLGIMIPPSIALLLYALITEQSVGEMFLAGILPGILAYSLYVITVILLARLWPARERSEPETANADTVLDALKRFLPAFGLFGLVMGGLYGGFFTPTEAGGAGALFALIYALFRGLTWKQFREAVYATVYTTATIFFILIGAEVLGFVISTSQLSFAMVDFMRDNGLTAWQILGAILLFYIVLGCFMESLAMILLTVPIFFPVIVAAGFDPVWFGIIAVVTVELGLISPPVGMNLFMVKSAAPELNIKTIMAGVLPFVVTDLVRLAILVAFPAIALFLPGRL